MSSTSLSFYADFFRLNRFMASVRPSCTQHSIASTAVATACSAVSRSCEPNLPSTWPEMSAPAGALRPMPIRNRANSSLPPSVSMIERKPLWPPLPPAMRNRICPSGRSASSTTTSNCDGSILSHFNSAFTAEPLRFIYVCGLASTSLPASPAMASAIFAENRHLLRKEQSIFSANRSSAAKPMLWRVPSYSRPGFPSPTTSFGLADTIVPPRSRYFLASGLPAGLASALPAAGALPSALPAAGAFASALPASAFGFASPSTAAPSSPSSFFAVMTSGSADGVDAASVIAANSSSELGLACFRLRLRFAFDSSAFFAFFLLRRDDFGLGRWRGRRLGHRRQFFFRDRRGNKEYGLSLVVEHRHTVRQCDVASVDTRTDFHLLHIDFEHVGQILRQTFDAQLAHDVFENATARFHARWFADGTNRHVRPQFLGRRDFMKINVQNHILVGVMLHFLDQREA